MNRNSLKRTACLSSALLLAACAQFGKQAPLEQPTAYSLAEGKSTAEAQEAWWLQLRDRKLNALVAAAVKSSPDLRAAKARFEQAQAQIGITEAANKAHFGLSAEGAGLYAAPKPSANQGNTRNHLTLAHVGLQGGISFDFWGKNRSRIAAGVGRRQAVLYEANHTRIELAHAVAAQYFVWQSLHSQKNLLEQRIAVADKTIKLIQRRIGAALMPPESLYPAELARQRLELEKIQIEQQISKVRNSLAVLSGKTPDSLPFSEPEKATLPPVLNVRRIQADFLAARPDIAAQKAILSAHKHSISATEAEFYPNIELNVLAGLAHIDAFSAVRNKLSATVGIAPALHLPLFRERTLQSRLAFNRAEYNEQVALYDQTVLQAMLAAAHAVADYQSASGKQAVAEKMRRTANQALQAARRRVKAGLDHGLFSLQKEDEALQLQAQEAQWQAELLTAWSNVHTQLGGGFRTKP